jgi:hypothetical protein
LEPELLEYGCPLDNGRVDGPNVASRTAASSIGTLKVPPLELLHGILLDELDLTSLTTLRSVSRGLRDVVDLLPQYHAIITHAPNGLRAAISLEVADSFSCRKLYTALCSSSCIGCGEFGAYLLTCSRVCYLCYTTDWEFLPITKQHSRIFWALNPGDIDSAGTAVARSLPSRYHPHSITSYIARHQLVDFCYPGDIAHDLRGPDHEQLVM